MRSVIIIGPLIPIDNMSRARLRPTGEDGSEYINASFVDVSELLCIVLYATYCVYSHILYYCQWQISVLHV